MIQQNIHLDRAAIVCLQCNPSLSSHAPLQTTHSRLHRPSSRRTPPTARVGCLGGERRTKLDPKKATTFGAKLLQVHSRTINYAPRSILLSSRRNLLEKLLPQAHTHTLIKTDLYVCTRSHIQRHDSTQFCDYFFPGSHANFTVWKWLRLLVIANNVACNSKSFIFSWNFKKNTEIIFTVPMTMTIMTRLRRRWCRLAWVQTLVSFHSCFVAVRLIFALRLRNTY